MPHLRGLYVKWSQVSGIDRLCDLESLRYLHLGTSTRVRSIEVLAKLSRLEWLGLENLLVPLFSMSRLETFETARWWDRSEIETIRRLNPKLAVAEPTTAVDKARD